MGSPNLVHFQEKSNFGTYWSQLMNDQQKQSRKNQLARWVQSVISGAEAGSVATPLQRVGNDAGFRNYYRVQSPEGTLVAVDAPVETEDTHSFVRIARQWREGGVKVPEVRAVDYEQGFMLQEDFGDSVLLAQLNEQNAAALYQQAFSALTAIQSQTPKRLPDYDEKLIRFELSIFPDWFLDKLLGLDDDIPDWQPLFSLLVESMLQQPVVTVHRDYHSRNLMVINPNELGVIDFQGALCGPLMYDAVSLLKDCYVRWPDELVNRWLKSFADQHQPLSQYDFKQIRYWFDVAGLQRHLKCLGIFARLWLRDGKPGYLDDIPRTFGYVLEVCRLYPQFHVYGQWLEDKVLPLLEERIKVVQSEAGVL